MAKHLQRDLDYLKRESLTVGAVVQDAIDNGDTEPFFDFAAMPDDWEVPVPTPPEQYIP